MTNVLMQGFNQPSHVAFGGKFAAPRQKTQGNYLGGLGGVIERLLPTIGSVGGAVGGSLLAPGVGTAAGGAAGSVLGRKLEDILTGQHTSASGYAGEAALGTLGGVGKGLGAIKGGVQAARAGEGITGAAQALRFGTKGAAAVEGGGLSNILAASKANAGKGAIRGGIESTTGTLGKQTLLSQAPGLSKGTAESAIRDVQGMKDLGYSNMSTMSKHAPFVTGENGLLTHARDELVNDPNARRIDTSSFLKQVQDHIDNNPDLNPAQEKKILSQASKLADKYSFQGDEQGIGSVHPANFNAAMKDVFNSAYTAAKDSPARKTLVGIGNSMRQPLKESLDSVPFTADHKNGIIRALVQSGVNKPQVIQAIRKASTAGDLANIESKFVTASNIAKDSAENSLRAGINMGTKPGLTQELNQAGAQVIGKPAKTAISAVSGGISKLAGRGVKQAPEDLGQLAGQTAKSVGLTQAAVRTPGLLASINQPQSQTDLSGQTTAGQDLTGQTPQDLGGQTSDLLGSTDTPQPDSQTPFTSANIQNAILQDIATTGGKNIDKLTGLYSVFGSPKAQQSSLTADQQKRMDNMAQAGATLQEYYNQLQEAGGGKGLAIGPAQSFLGKIGLGGQGAAQAKALEATRVDIATTLAQAMTGNSRPAQQQVNLWLNSIPQISDPQAVAKQKLENIMGLIQARTGAIQ